NYRGFIGQDIAEQILGQDNVKPSRIRNDVHRRRVDIKMIEFNLRILSADPRHRLPPKLRGLEDVRFINGSYFAATLRGRFEGDPRNALNLAHRVTHRVEGG